MLFSFLRYDSHSGLSLVKLVFDFRAQFLEFQFHVGLLVEFILVELNFNDFFLQF